MENTFQKEITFLSKNFVVGSDGNEGKWEDTSVTKIATFKELSQTDRDQHKLHFKVVSLFEMLNNKSEDDQEGGKLNISTDALYDLTTKCIKTLLVTDEKEFTEADKNEFLSDSGAILNFSMWMLKEKLMPFFSKFKMS